MFPKEAHIIAISVEMGVIGYSKHRLILAVAVSNATWKRERVVGGGGLAHTTIARLRELSSEHSRIP